jgi:NAD-dependent DNA ligase/DNA polymerase/3'-5' exonuclease PolX
MNHNYISVLSELGDLLGRRGEMFRAKAYNQASDAIALYPHAIECVDELKGVKGIGKTILAKLQEYATTGRIEALEKERSNPLHVLTKVYGIGPKKAKSLLDQGITTLDDLRANTHLLTSASQAGLRHYDDIEARIPRAEINRYEDLLRKIMPEDISFDIVGSYRRGAESSGDIDIIMTHPESTWFQAIVDGLIERNILIEVLSRGDVKCLGIGQLEGCRARRLDFLYAPPDEYAFATLYFTGSKTFNTIQRQRALDMGYSLNEHGFTYVHSGEMVDSANFPSEKSIFDFLRMPYVAPSERNRVKPTGVEIDINQASEIELSDYIRRANHAYYQEGRPIITDAKYDLLCSTTLRRFPGNMAAVEGHTQSVVGRNKAILPYEMWSMDKIKPDTTALQKWTGQYHGPYVLSTKLDGVSGLYTTNDGVPKLYTRGNGVTGQDVSHLIPYLAMPMIQDIAIRGEFVIKKTTFQTKYADTFANSRNFVAGLINQKEPDVTVLGDIDFVAYEVLNPVLKPSEQFNWLAQTGICIAKNITHSHITNERLSAYLLEWRTEYEFEIDGVICCQDTVTKRVSGNPKHAFAFKMVLSDQMAETTVNDVIWTASKDGYLKPRVRLEPVVLGGATIEYATGFNAQFIQANRVGVGAIVRLVRSGDVIPHIVEVVMPAEQSAMPIDKYVWNESGVDVLLADVDNDTTVQLKNVTGFFRGIGVDGLSEGNVQRLIDTGYDTVPKIIQMNEADYLKVPGFQSKTAHKLYTGIRQRLGDASLPELMHATNLFGRGFGVKKFAAILAAYGTPEISVEQAMLVPGMAHKTASKYVAHLPAFLSWIEETNLHDKMVEKNTNKSVEILPYHGKRFVMTGFRDKALTNALVSMGAEPSTTVSKNTWLVIVKDTSETTGKATEARNLGVRIVTPTEIKNMMSI